MSRATIFPGDVIVVNDTYVFDKTKQFILGGCVADLSPEAVVLELDRDKCKVMFIGRGVKDVIWLDRDDVGAVLVDKHEDVALRGDSTSFGYVTKQHDSGNISAAINDKGKWKPSFLKLGTYAFITHSAIVSYGDISSVSQKSKLLLL